MQHQPTDFETFSASQRRRMHRQMSAKGDASKQAAVQTALLIEAIDEAFATLPSPSSEKKPADDAGQQPAGELRTETSSLADMLAAQLKDLDQQRGRLARLLSQIEDASLDTPIGMQDAGR
jgi:hypothetical protein